MLLPVKQAALWPKVVHASEPELFATGSRVQCLPRRHSAAVAAYCNCAGDYRYVHGRRTRTKPDSTSRRKLRPRQFLLALRAATSGRCGRLLGEYDREQRAFHGSQRISKRHSEDRLRSGARAGTANRVEQSHDDHYGNELDCPAGFHQHLRRGGFVMAVRVYRKHESGDVRRSGSSRHDGRNFGEGCDRAK